MNMNNGRHLLILDFYSDPQDSITEKPAIRRIQLVSYGDLWLQQFGRPGVAVDL